MKTLKTSLFALLFVSLLISCSKEGDTIINNYNGSGDTKAPTRKLMKSYGLADTSQTINFTYLNNDLTKLKELISVVSGVPSAKYVILYNSSNVVEGYQSYTMPANTLNEQGTFKLDSKGRIIEVIKRKINGDTIGINTFGYTNLDYQPVSFTHFEKSVNRISKMEFMSYDNNGNLTRLTSYTNNGTDPIYKSGQVEASSFSKAINPLNELHPYLVAVTGSYGFSGQGPLYFSNYFPSSVVEENFKSDGSANGASVNTYMVEADADNYLTSLSAGSQKIIIKY
ncbi:MAG: hypothetical protein V4613_07940 [Bacteroidota bacterium]